MTKEIIHHYSIRKLSIGAVSVIVGSFFLASGQTVHADTMNDANLAQTQSNNKSVESNAIDTKQLAIDQMEPDQSSSSAAKPNQVIDSKVKVNKQENSIYTDQAAQDQLKYWQYTTDDSNVYLKDYTNVDNTDDLIIPNGADFTQAQTKDATNKAVQLDGDDLKNILHKFDQNNKTLTVAVSHSKIANQQKLNKVVATGDWTAEFAAGKQIEERNYTTENNQNSEKIEKPKKATFSSNDKLTKLDLTNLDVSQLYSFSDMFSGNHQLTTVGDLSDWNTAHNTDISYMFYDDLNLQNIGTLDKWNTSNVVFMNHAFDSTPNLATIGDLSQWQTCNVRDMSYMFNNDLTLKNSQKANDPSGKEQKQESKLTTSGDLSQWQTDNVQDMSYMFNNDLTLKNNQKANDPSGKEQKQESKLTTLGDLSNWDTSKTKYMSYMFNDNPNLESVGKLNNWDTSNVHDMSFMFNNDQKLTGLDLSNWNVDKIIYISYMFANNKNAKSLGDLSSWNLKNVLDTSNMFVNCTNLTDLGDLSNWNMNQVKYINHMFQNCSNLVNIGNLSNWNTEDVIDASYMFANDENLKQLDLTKWNTPKLTNVSYMFNNCKNLTSVGNLSNWDTVNMQWFNNMFQNATSIKTIGDKLNWNLENALNFSFMFDNAASLISFIAPNLNASKVEYFNHMFKNCTNLQTVDLTNLDASSCLDLSYMFYNDKNLTSFAGKNIKTDKVKYFNNMFDGCINLVQFDGTGWNTQNAISFAAMFNNDNKLTKLPGVSQGDVKNATDLRSMFCYMGKLITLDLSNWVMNPNANLDSLLGADYSLNLIANDNSDPNSFVKYLLSRKDSFDKNTYDQGSSRINTMVYSVKTDSLDLMHYLSNTRFTDQATRDIRIEMPNGNVEKIEQYVNYEKFPKTALIIISGTPKGQHQYEMNNTVLGDYIAQNGQGATIENGIGTFNKVKLPKIAGYKAMIKQILSANLLNQLFMVRFIAIPSKKISVDNEKQQEPNMRKDITSFSDNKTKTDNKISSQIIDMPKARSTETNNEIPSQMIDMPKARSTETDNEIPSQMIDMPKARSTETDNEIPSQMIDMPKARSTETDNNRENENPKAKSASNAIMMNVKTGKIKSASNITQPRSITHRTLVKKANASIMPKSKIALKNEKSVANKIQSHDQSANKTKLHKTATLLPQTGEDQDTVIGIIGALAILLALIGFKKTKENKKD